MLETAVRDGVVFALPLFIMAVGGIYSEKSGITNLALEGMQGAGAFTGALSAVLLGGFLENLRLTFYLSVILAMFGGMLYAMLFASLCIRLSANQVISGVVMNILAVALTAFLTKYLNKSIFDSPSDKLVLNVSERFTIPVLSRIPVLGALFREVYPFEILIVAIGILSWYILYKTRFGMHLRACGDNPHAVDAAGISVGRTRFAAVSISGALSGLAGISFAYSVFANFSGSIYAGYGYLAIAAMIFGGWRILPALFACLLFGVSRALGYGIIQKLQMPGSYSDLMMILPYAVTLLLLVFYSGRGQMPQALGEVYDRGKR